MVTHVLPLTMIEIKEYIDAKGVNHFSKWFNKLNAQAAAKVTVYLTRIQQGNFSRVESVGEGVFECRIDFGVFLTFGDGKGRRQTHP